MKVLVIDDEEQMLDLLSLLLEMNDFEVLTTTSGKEAIQLVKEQHINIVLLDIMMPSWSGWDICKEIRSFSTIPIIMVTARDDSNDIIKGFKLGADDYVTKPFHKEILLARIHALLRREPAKNILEFKGLILDKERYYIGFKGKELVLTPIEYRMVSLFLSHLNRIFTRDDLIELIWEGDSFIENRTVDSHIRNLRDKLRKAGFEVDTYLKTIYGFGYRWESK